MKHMRKPIRFSALIAVALLSACGQLVVQRPLPPLPPQPALPVWAAAQPQNDTESLLWYAQWSQALPPAQLTREQEAARHALHASNSDFDRLRLACALSLSAQGEEWSRVLELTDAVVKNTASPLRPLANLLQTQFAERRRLEASAAGLQDKLDALKSLEKSMNDRGTKK